MFHQQQAITTQLRHMQIHLLNSLHPCFFGDIPWIYHPGYFIHVFCISHLWMIVLWLRGVPDANVHCPAQAVSRILLLDRWTSDVKMNPSLETDFIWPLIQRSLKIRLANACYSSDCR